MKSKTSDLTISKTMRFWITASVLIGLQMFFAQSYAATSKDNDFNKLVSKAGLIVFGKCTVVTTEWRKNKIYSIAIIRVNEVVKGSASSEIQIEYMGGTAVHPKLNAPIEMKVSNGISFTEGDEAVLMLRKLQNNRFQVTGSSRGKISVATDMESGEKIIQ